MLAPGWPGPGVQLGVRIAIIAKPGRRLAAVRRGDTGGSDEDVAAPGWAEGCSGSLVSSRSRRGPAALQRTGQGSQWVAAARHDGSPVSRPGEREGKGKWGFYPGSMTGRAPGAWVQTCGYRGWVGFRV